MSRPKETKENMPNNKLHLEKIVDSLATISDIIFKRLHCMECNQCEPCGPVFMAALKTLREAGKVRTTAEVSK
jgi:hypothetical protein